MCCRIILASINHDVAVIFIGCSVEEWDLSLSGLNMSCMGARAIGLKKYWGSRIFAHLSFESRLVSEKFEEEFAVVILHQENDHFSLFQVRIPADLLLQPSSEVRRHLRGNHAQPSLLSNILHVQVLLLGWDALELSVQSIQPSFCLPTSLCSVSTSLRRAPAMLMPHESTVKHDEQPVVEDTRRCRHWIAFGMTWKTNAAFIKEWNTFHHLNNTLTYLTRQLYWHT